MSLTSESESDSEEAVSSRRASVTSKREATAAATSNLKRKHHASSHQPSPKRQKSTLSAAGDPTRSYCLKKLQEVFSGIFLKYPNIPSDHATEEQFHSLPAGKKPEDLTDVEKTKLEDDANKFATELEQCVYDIYSEPDAKGRTHAGSKYKYVTYTFPLTQTLMMIMISQRTFPHAYV